MSSDANANLGRMWNTIFNGRRNRRAAYRKYLKANKVPRPIFPLISQKRDFNRLNLLTFIDDIRLALEKREQQQQQPKEEVAQ